MQCVVNYFVARPSKCSAVKLNCIADVGIEGVQIQCNLIRFYLYDKD